MHRVYNTEFLSNYEIKSLMHSYSTIAESFDNTEPRTS